MTRFDPQLLGAFRLISRAAGVFCAVLGVLDLVGWSLGIPLLIGNVFNLSPMIPHTGFLFILVGLSLCLKNQPSSQRLMHRISLALSLYVGLAGLLFVSEYLFGWNLGIDQLWFSREVVVHTPLYPGRPSPQSALNFVLAGLALSLMDVEASRRWHLTEAIALLLASIPFLAILGYAYQLPLLYDISVLKPIAFNSAFSFCFLAIGILFARPDRGWMGVFSSNTPGGHLLRRLLPATLVVPPFLAWINFLIEQAGYYDVKTGDAFLVLTVMILAIALICGNAGSFNRVEAEREKAAEALQRSASEVQDLYNNAPCGYHSLNKDGLFLQINDTELRWLGYDREEVVGKLHFPDVLTLDSARRFAETFPLFKTRGHIEDLEYDLLRKDGTPLPVLLSATAIQDPAGRFLMSRSTIFDITRRKQAEQLLSEINHQLNLILDSAGEGIYGLDGSGRCSFINQAATRMLGFEKDELIGQHSHALFHHSRPDGSPFPEAECPAHQVLAGTPLQVANDVFWRKDGMGFPVEYVTSPILEGGKAIGGVVVFRDVTERRAMEEALQKSHAMLSEAQRIARMGSWEWEAESDRLILSDEVYRIIGIDPQALEPTLENYLQMVRPEDRSEFRAKLEDALREREPVGFQQRIRRPDGLERDVLIRAEFADKETSHGAHMVGTLQDITELKKAEAEIAQRTAELHQAQELARMKDIFISTISHEMKTPLSLIIGYTELLEEKYPDDEFLTQLAEGSQKLASHISNIIDYSAMLSGRMPLYKTEVNFSELIENAREAFKESFKSRRLHLEIELDPQTPPIQADSHRISQALTELLENAERFTPAGGTIGIRTSVVGGCVRLDVWDTGQGIVEKDLPRLWSAFSQLSIDEALRKGGLGLGLTIVKKITEMHGGTVAVESHVGEGSCFSLFLPREQS